MFAQIVNYKRHIQHIKSDLQSCEYKLNNAISLQPKNVPNDSMCPRSCSNAQDINNTHIKSNVYQHAQRQVEAEIPATKVTPIKPRHVRFSDVVEEENYPSVVHVEENKCGDGCPIQEYNHQQYMYDDLEDEDLIPLENMYTTISR